ncbi:hypothetical protein KJ865_06515, partial [Myxococcota bacterium]|nr:hypothetical protein [Myxococcota bacterium]
PDSTKLLLRMVVLQYRSKDYQQALLYLDRLKRMDPNSFNLLKIEGEIWKAYGNTEECEKSWLSAYHLKPSDVSHAFNLVELMLEQNRVADAQKILKTTLRVVRSVQEKALVEKKLHEIQFGKTKP